MAKAGQGAMKSARVAIVIVNYRSAPLVCTCLASLATNLRLDWHAIVVDNSAPDGAYIKQRFPEVVVLDSGGNPGFAGGCNVGIDYALARGYDFILLLNPDTRATEDFLTPMVAVMENHAAYGVLGPKILRDDGSGAVWNCGGRLNWWLGGQRRLLGDGPPGTAVQQVTYLSGCALLLRARAVREAGLMDEQYFLYFEDSDYVQRLLHAGWQAGYVASARLLHRVSATTTVHSPAYVYFFARNRVWFMRRWAKPLPFLVFTLYVTLIKCPAALLYFGVYRRAPLLVWRFWAGTWEGYVARLRDRQAWEKQGGPPARRR